MSVKNDEVRYCVTAILDLLGFSAHLEIAGNDLRTSIGREAINRLQVLEDALELVTHEHASCPEAYPNTYHIKRINDAVIFTMDLPDLLKPAVGASVKQGLTAKEMMHLFDVSQFDNDADFMAAYQAKLSEDVTGLVQFVGMIARFHSFVNRKESIAYFPGARTIISSGYRLPFETKNGEDFLSANFSFSNAYCAEEHLHGPRFFLDNNLAQMLYVNKFIRNLLRFACFTTQPVQFDPLLEHEDVFELKRERMLAQPIEVTLFRKSFHFRELDTRPLSFSQTIPRISPYLEGLRQLPEESKAFKMLAKNVIKAITNGPGTIKDGCTASFPRRDRIELDEDIRSYIELIETGEWPTFNSQDDNR